MLPAVTRRTARTRPLRLDPTFPIHPLLAAAYPVIFLFAANAADQVTLQPLWLPLFVAMAAAAVAFAVLWALLRDPWRAGLVVTVLVTLFLWYGHAWNLTGHIHRQPGAARRGVDPGGGGRRGRSRCGPASGGGRRARSSTSRRRPSSSSTRPRSRRTRWADRRRRRRPHRARRAWRIRARRTGPTSTTSSSTDTARARSWPSITATTTRHSSTRCGSAASTSPTEAFANYIKTPLSLVSSLNMEYLDGDALQAEAASGKDAGVIHRQLRGALRVPTRAQGARLPAHPRRQLVGAERDERDGRHRPPLRGGVGVLVRGAADVGAGRDRRGSEPEPARPRRPVRAHPLRVPRARGHRRRPGAEVRLRPLPGPPSAVRLPRRRLVRARRADRDR